MSEIFTLTVTDEFEGLRLDQWMALELSEMHSRSQIQKWIDSKCVQTVQGDVKSSRKVEADEQYTVFIPEIEPFHVDPVDLKIKVLFEDKDLAVIVKPPGIAVHPGPGQNKVTLINGLYYLWKDLKPTEENIRPGIVHRLDAPTEGVMVIAKNTHIHHKLADQFKDRTTEKEYSAWLLSSPPETEGRIELPIRRHRSNRLKMAVDPKGREAITEYRAEKYVTSNKGRKFCLVDLKIFTGRTHQIRVHMSQMGCPIVGDELYSRSAKEFGKFGLLLLARRLAFTHPATGERMQFETEMPQRFLDFERKCAFY